MEIYFIQKLFFQKKKLKEREAKLKEKEKREKKALLAKRAREAEQKRQRSQAIKIAAATKIAKSPKEVIGKYQYAASYKGNIRREKMMGTITLTDVGIRLSGEQFVGNSQPDNYTFFDAFKASNVTIFRSNYTNSTWGHKDFRVVWRPFWIFQDNTILRFDKMAERDRFFFDLVRAIGGWALKHANFAKAKIKIDQRCMNTGNYWTECSSKTQ